MPEQRHFIEIPLRQPIMGGKAWVIEESGLFVLERGGGVLRTVACTHAGSGSCEAADGVPDENGFFQIYSPHKPPAECEPGKPGWGRRLFRGSPVVMGSWMLDAGFSDGLTFRYGGGTDGVAMIATIVWMLTRKPPS